MLINTWIDEILLLQVVKVSTDIKINCHCTRACNNEGVVSKCLCVRWHCGSSYAREESSYIQWPCTYNYSYFINYLLFVWQIALLKHMTETVIPSKYGPHTYIFMLIGLECMIIDVYVTWSSVLPPLVRHNVLYCAHTKCTACPTWDC